MARFGTGQNPEQPTWERGGRELYAWGTVNVRSAEEKPAGLAADGLLQFVLARVVLGFFRGELAQFHQAVYQRLVARELDQAALAEVVGAAIAHVADDDVVGVHVDPLGRAAHAALAFAGGA